MAAGYVEVDCWLLGETGGGGGGAAKRAQILAKRPCFQAKFAKRQIGIQPGNYTAARPPARPREVFRVQIAHLTEPFGTPVLQRVAPGGLFAL